MAKRHPENTMNNDNSPTDSTLLAKSHEEVAAHFVRESKQFRKDLDFHLQKLKASTRQSRERSLAKTKIEEAIMWLGMDLKAINEANPGASPNPYPQSYNPDSPVVSPTADGVKL